MKYLFLLLSSCLPFFTLAQQNPATPDRLYGQLFVDVQMQQIFPNSKTFADAIPKRKVADIMYEYGMQKGPAMDLKKFVADNFSLPEISSTNIVQPEKDINQHIKNLWKQLKKEADVSSHWEGKGNNGNSLIPLPYPHMLPAANAREINYWNSYFIMLGLKETGDIQLLENMVKNFEYLIHLYGHVPAGNRTYYVSRSQPPFFCMMVDLLASVKGKQIYKTYLPAMLAEYGYWMEGSAAIKNGSAFKQLVKLPDGNVLNRYWDEGAKPRSENYKEDMELAEAIALELAMRIKVSSPERLQQILNDAKATAYRNIRTAASSAWPYSSRWLGNPQQLNSIQTTDMLPVDLNSLLYKSELIISKALAQNNELAKSKIMASYAAKRKAAIQKYCWNATAGFYGDYNFVYKEKSEVLTAAGLFPLFVKISTTTQAVQIAKTVSSNLLKEGGIVSSTVNSGQQWDAPYGYASMQWISSIGFKDFGNDLLAKKIAQRWMAVCENNFTINRTFNERYNVADIKAATIDNVTGANEQFAATAAVYAALKKFYPNLK